jgi:hypothetical protein
MHRRWRDDEPVSEGAKGMFPSAERDVDVEVEEER